MRHSLQQFARAARHHGTRAYHGARHLARGLDATVVASAKIYGRILQPILRSQGYDTSELDKHLLKTHSLYNELKDQVSKGHQIVEGVAANLRGGDFKYAP